MNVTSVFECKVSKLICFMIGGNKSESWKKINKIKIYLTLRSYTFIVKCVFNYIEQIHHFCFE